MVVDPAPATVPASSSVLEPRRLPLPIPAPRRPSFPFYTDQRPTLKWLPRNQIQLCKICQKWGLREALVVPVLIHFLKAEVRTLLSSITDILSH